MIYYRMCYRRKEVHIMNKSFESLIKGWHRYNKFIETLFNRILQKAFDVKRIKADYTKY